MATVMLMVLIAHPFPPFSDLSSSFKSKPQVILRLAAFTRTGQSLKQPDLRRARSSACVWKAKSIHSMLTDLRLGAGWSSMGVDGCAYPVASVSSCWESGKRRAFTSPLQHRAPAALWTIFASKASSLPVLSLVSLPFSPTPLVVPFVWHCHCLFYPFRSFPLQHYILPEPSTYIHPPQHYLPQTIPMLVLVQNVMESKKTDVKSRMLLVCRVTLRTTTLC